MEKKDFWDKADVVAKFLIPIAVAMATVYWSNASSDRANSARMTEIALSVLTDEPRDETIHLRLWAISVLQRPHDPPALSIEAAGALEFAMIPRSNARLPEGAIRLSAGADLFVLPIDYEAILGTLGAETGVDSVDVDPIEFE